MRRRVVTVRASRAIREEFAASCRGRRRDHGAAMLVRFALLLAVATLVGVAAQVPSDWTPEIPRVWDESALADWATPVAGLNVRPTHMTAGGYYALPEENLRTYPVYLPGREPEGYAERIRTAGPQAADRTRSAETEAGLDSSRASASSRDSVVLRTFDPKLIAMARDRHGR